METTALPLTPCGIHFEAGKNVMLELMIHILIYRNKITARPVLKYFVMLYNKINSMCMLENMQKYIKQHADRRKEHSSIRLLQCQNMDRLFCHWLNPTDILHIPGQ